jgi:uncharacterized protein (DUF1499 family)
MQTRTLVVLCLSSTATGLQLTRRDLAQAIGIGAAGAAGALAPAANAADIKACSKGANNCWSTASTDKTSLKPWTFPNQKTAAKELRAALEAYPQAGQNKVDEGGWSFAVDELDKSGYARLEYKSGLGNMAKYFNGNQPFVDDLEVLVGGDSVSVRSSSRVGDSDLGVNAKRLAFLAKDLKAKGWDVVTPPVK